MGTTSPVRTAVMAVVFTAIVAPVAACGDDAGPATPATSAVTVTSSATGNPSPSAAVDTGSAQGSGGEATDPAVDPTAATAADEPCGPRDLSRATIDAAIAKIAPDPLGAWVPKASNFSTCNDISYVVLENGGGMSASDDQLLIFGRQGNFLGTGIRCITSRQNVRSATGDSILVDYSADRSIPGPPNQVIRPTYPITFRWNGSRVVMEGTLPYEITQGRC